MVILKNLNKHLVQIKNGGFITVVKKLSYISILTNNFNKDYKFYVEVLGLKDYLDE